MVERVKGVIQDRLGTQRSRIPARKVMQRTAQELLCKQLTKPVHNRIRSRLNRWYDHGIFKLRSEPE